MYGAKIMLVYWCNNKNKRLLPVVTYDGNEGGCSGSVVLMFEQDERKSKYKIL